jgi:hypothetical protein
MRTQKKWRYAMIYRSFSILIMFFTILTAGMMTTGPAIGGQIVDTSPIIVAATMTFEGLLAVKEADGVFLVRAEDGKKKRFTVNKNTMITRNGKPAAYGDLRSRDHILVQYDSNFVVMAIKASGT